MLQQAAAQLRDTQGRVARYLRVSLTDRCQLRCRYCMPADLAWMPNERLLSAAELSRLITIAVTRLGVRKVRFTGGEPLLRPDVASIIASVPPDAAVSLTTNGLELPKHLPGLVSAGLKSVNISIDALNRRTYAHITGRDRLADALAGLRQALEARLRVKVNTVILRGVNEGEILPLADFCLANGCELRFIEQMPLGPLATDPVSAAEILTALRARYELRPLPRTSAPTQLYDVGGGRIGVIATVSFPFCQLCDRTRLTADGHVRACLFDDTEHDLRTPLRAGASDEELAYLWLAAQRQKAPGHLIGQASFRKPVRTMSMIGG
ncbi:MAG: GTP 3',8-cyclase MoaA [Propionibacteriaceae bacterium]|jgi:cyclic pyranopterin phosphate synthase|nr:GTP 3',8-cyclase MoaA [Propionibacteriaceae bacterium]